MVLNEAIPGAPNFTWAELITTSRKEFWEGQKAGLQNERVKGALTMLARAILQPIRTHIGRPLTINSGYRCAALNASLSGSAKNSQHLYGEAADIAVPGWGDRQLFDLWQKIAFSGSTIAKEFALRGHIGQVIYEDNRPGRDGGAWIHISLGMPFRAAERCDQKLTYSPRTGWDHHKEPPPQVFVEQLLGPG